VSASFVEPLDTSHETFEYSKIGSAIRRISLHIMKRVRPFRKEIYFIQQFESRGDRLARSMDFLSTIRNIHKGERIFIIANGPSLDYRDLEKITNEVSIASNFIHLAYEHTTWRPNYVTVSDTKVWAKMTPEIQKQSRNLILLDRLDSRRAVVEHSSVRQRSPGDARNRQFPFSDNLCWGAFGGHTVTYFNLQLAHHLGAGSIVLLGLDHSYEESNSSSKTTVVNQKINHFHPDYRHPGEVVFKAPIEQMASYYRIARTVSDKKGVRILNATPDTNLSIFPVTSLSNVLNAGIG